ncbi:MAG: hypothetical protein ACJ78Q_02315 [Chloroflexia bacterium]
MEEPRTPINRTAEEMAWDEEFADNSRSGLGSNVRDVASLVVRIPRAMVEVATGMLPPETVRHSRAAVRESFLAVRSLVSAAADGVEEMLSDSGTSGTSTVQGPGGTWGTGRATTTTSPKVKRIDVGGTDYVEPITGPGDMP